MGLRWTDSQDIPLALLDAHPEVDPKTIRFTDLHRWIRELDEFEDDPNRSNERILEAIQMCWIEESED